MKGKILIFLICCLCFLCGCTNSKIEKDNNEDKGLLDYLKFDLIYFELTNIGTNEKLYENGQEINYVNIIIKENLNNNIDIKGDITEYIDNLIENEQVIKLVITDEMKSLCEKYDKFIIQLGISEVDRLTLVNGQEKYEKIQVLDARLKVGTLLCVKENCIFFNDLFLGESNNLLGLNSFLKNDNQKLKNGSSLEEFKKWHKNLLIS